jgi:hypothetical protein
MAHALDVNPVIDSIVGRRLPAKANMLSLVMIAWGVGAVVYGYAAADGGEAWTLGAILVGLVYSLCIAQGSVMFCVILTGAWARWGRPFKRVAEALGVFLPVVYALMVVFLLTSTHVYAWNPDTIIAGGAVPLEPHSPEAYAAKPFWLNKWFFIGRHVFGLGLLTWLSVRYIRASLRPDLVQAKARLGDKAPAWWDRIIDGETDLVKARAEGIDGQSNVFPYLVISYALLFSMMAFDLLMSLSPWWFSNMFGAWICMSSVYVSMATIGLTTMVARDWLHIGPFVQKKSTHDLGKLILAACMFWAYTTFSQLLPIWYTDMPEETDYLLVRLYLPHWRWLSQTVAIMCFLAPFTVLLSRGIKKLRWPFAAVCLLIMSGIFLERSLLVMPSVYFGDHFPVLDFILVNVGVLAGMAGLFIQVTGRFLAQVPGVGISDPYLSDHPWDVHVHAAHEEAAK